MDARVRPYRAATLLLLGSVLVVEGPRLGWWTLLPLAAVVGLYAFLNPRLERMRRPEYAAAGAWASCQVAIAVSAALTGDARTTVMTWLLLPVATLPARFGARGVIAGVTFTALLVVALVVGAEGSAGMRESLVFPLSALIGMGILSSALLRSDLEHRSQAVVDPLTGMLNRAALTARAGELTQLSAVSGSPVALVVVDVDRFKSINDGHGHTTGDVVLRELADALRARLRAYDLVYRYGGEEFVVVLPGADEDAAAALAEDLRIAVSERPMAGLNVTASFGVAASAPGEFEFNALFREADLALYRAKGLGRDRVERANSLAAV